MPGKKRVSVPVVKVTFDIPMGVHERMVEAIRDLRLWDGQAVFMREAIVQKLRREGFAPAAPSRASRKIGKRGKRP